VEVGHGRRFGLEGGRSFVIAAARQAGEALFAHEHSQGIDADSMAGQSQFALDVIDGEVLFAQGHGQLADAIAHRSPVGAGFGVLEEGGAFLGVVAEVVAENAQGVGGITEAAGDLGAGQFLDEEGAEGFVLAVER
jgi:hypothetical protein